MTAASIASPSLPAVSHKRRVRPRTYDIICRRDRKLTSIGDKKVTVRFRGPAVMTYIVLVGVNWMFVIFETFC